MTEMAAAVYQRGCWFMVSISEVKIMWNITMQAGVDMAVPDTNMVVSPHNMCRCGDTAGAVVDGLGDSV
jgi:hypothetical protein